MYEHFSALVSQEISAPQAKAVGYVTRVVGLTLEARGINVALGSRCRVEQAAGKIFEVEAVGFDGATTFLMPLHPVEGLAPGAKVRPIKTSILLPAGVELLGRVVNGIGQPIDDRGALGGNEYTSFHPATINPLAREPITEPLDIGICSINAALTVGCGQRVGLFAGSGVGKSVLLGMMTRFTEAEAVVVALVGERGREVREFVENNLGAEGMAKAVVVASPADDTPVMRLRAGMYAARLSEYFRDRGMKTLLLFDSLTRYAQAQREIALATGEPPATRGYPPSVFALLPQLVERAGNSTGSGGSVTGFYTVLTEEGDINDPVGDAARAILDGHIVLSRDIAGEGIYPAVDIQASISRVMNQIVSQDQLILANQLRQWLARYADSKDLITVGAYNRGVDAVTDLAIDKQPAIREFLNQSLNQSVNYQQSTEALSSLVYQAEPPTAANENELSTEVGPASDQRVAQTVEVGQTASGEFVR